ncbi:MAG: HAD hydrolase-like protein [Candidatus Bathyarchaeota archaeon]|nr:HAD hydrolase-like protein [Candidatus Bathyarchaeota archaeon]
MTEAVIFDLDGTLINLPINYEKLFKEVREILNMNNVRPFLKTVSQTRGRKRAMIFKAWEEAELEALPKVTLNPKGKVIYEEYRKKPKALVTMQSRKFLEAFLRQFGLVFKGVVTREDSMNRVKQLEIARKTLGLKFADILFVGNKEYDLVAAEKVKCRFQWVGE